MVLIYDQKRNGNDYRSHLTTIVRHYLKASAVPNEDRESEAGKSSRTAEAD